ncbi:nitroreductase family protein [Candidatus Bathyarchaeota archaeon]|nr:nitroreductase family protein [Candidatus Bathyarchaeota archaeon]
MSVLEAIEKRRSIRKYKPTSIPVGDLKKILEAGRLAPSASNRQVWSFIVVQNSEQKKLLVEAAAKRVSIIDAGVIVVALADAEVSPRYGKLDVMIAVENMVLASTSLGYGTCWMGAAEEEKIKNVLGIPERLSVVVLLSIGVSDESPEPKPRKDFCEIFFQDKYGKPLVI